jgi:poly(A) polymerase
MAEMSRSARLGKMLDQAASWVKPAFPLGGGDVIAAGIPAGPRVGELLSKLEDEWVEENFAADRAALLARLSALVK